MTPQDVLKLREEAIASLYDNTGEGLQKLVDVTIMEAALRETGQRPLYPKPAPLTPRVVLTPLITGPLPPPVATEGEPKRKTFDPQMKLF